MISEGEVQARKTVKDGPVVPGIPSVSVVSSVVAPPVVVVPEEESQYGVQGEARFRLFCFKSDVSRTATYLSSYLLSSRRYSSRGLDE